MQVWVGSNIQRFRVDRWKIKRSLLEKLCPLMRLSSLTIFSIHRENTYNRRKVTAMNRLTLKNKAETEAAPQWSLEPIRDRFGAEN
jgi:hypothetical protein